MMLLYIRKGRSLPNPLTLSPPVARTRFKLELLASLVPDFCRVTVGAVAAQSELSAVYRPAPAGEMQGWQRGPMGPGRKSIDGSYVPPKAIDEAESP